ncbi:CcdC protein domain-containing protein [Streptomyces rhizosphaerihabitans]|uniref:CcdC protein domain-containing protein n=1 Tax=Streptomyces rhizosphaerihabitans TaxID=1266770 RepID=UPI0021BEF0D6|nr:CcdC protein domain-containing protein [Streptomyces rhizosphaerihabitans]MCT9009309.1 DUF1453 family protein [Streptomyces rhizosphaerihabitans]
MSGLINAVVIVAVAVVVIARQFRARRISSDRRWWIVPAVLGFMALRDPGVIGPHHRVEASLLLGTELVTALALGAGWAWTTRIWTEPDGAVWSKSTKASGAIWIAGICLRLGLFGIGALLSVHQNSSALMLGLAATLLVRSGVVTWRAQSLQPTAMGQGPAYGDGVGRVLRKERL